ncbi:phosphoribosylglycinamide formyltransferase [Collibacillus ludicampi]|uniref:Phosphoribosylglycinamide formyltransferase n=1 Tax=Collibacillus ludicampi TaxID=2771369 RepID=A0AAV4LCH8_9BACL|nr:phosphoribosylglycinamide formyltransferase [Collibacillus ludicampi]GIM45465.1 phosphoribosylglycinamide formyltransferase [Collibacillus ludicampi]
MKRVAVFASGSGSNLQVLLDKAKNDELGGAVIELVVSDKPEAKAVERAKQAGVPCLALVPKEFADKAAYEERIVRELKQREIDFIVLAGYMRLCGPILLEAYGGRIINLHPSLLPAFPGKDAIGQALAYGVKYTGVTVHFVDEGMDTGPIIAQEPVKIHDHETKEELTRRVQEVEHRLLPQVLIDWVEGRIHVDGRVVIYENRRGSKEPTLQ